ncbi:hypothetical protein LO772_29715 [Yinghuangia sp. ASG 101]|uniref:hypothetical protein n=1 Tax=Yinghuangia sp. ASG 101 TaxID=2896848 RepID=UPI001E64609F|nr:hypothetical protein [Yinghuangia sp. ASG 101]UGQ10946.1 hypothetical protein LO772_29715 [Yinghuangia sp. ASG 101]
MQHARIVIAVGVLMGLTVLAVAVAWIASPGDADTTRPTVSVKARPPVSPAAGNDPAPSPRLKTREPVVFAKAFATRLWSYDTRTDTHSGHVSELLSWLTDEQSFADPASVTARIPDPVLWSRMHDNNQYATSVIHEAHFPASFTAALNADPGRLTTAYAYAVTVTGKQTTYWTGAGPGTDGSGAEDRVVTLAVQCRPDRDCGLIGITPGIAP